MHFQGEDSMRKSIDRVRLGILILISFAALMMRVGDIASFIFDPDGKEIDRMLVTQATQMDLPADYKQERTLASDRGGIHSLRLIYKSENPVKESEIIEALEGMGFQVKHKRVESTIEDTHYVTVLENDTYACVVKVTDEHDFSLSYYYKTPVERLFGARY